MLLGKDTYDAGSEQCDFIESLFHVDVKPNTKVGVTCTPITAIGVGSGSGW